MPVMLVPLLPDCALVMEPEGINCCGYDIGTPGSVFKVVGAPCSVLVSPAAVSCICCSGGTYAPGVGFVENLVRCWKSVGSGPATPAVGEES